MGAITPWAGPGPAPVSEFHVCFSMWICKKPEVKSCFWPQMSLLRQKRILQPQRASTSNFHSFAPRLSEHIFHWFDIRVCSVNKYVPSAVPPPFADLFRAKFRFVKAQDLFGEDQSAAGVAPKQYEDKAISKDM